MSSTESDPDRVMTFPEWCERRDALGCELIRVADPGSIPAIAGQHFIGKSKPYYAPCIPGVHH